MNGTHKTTMQDIANELKITKVSVSKALSGQSGVSDELRDKIVNTAQKLGYKNKTFHKQKATYKFAFIVAKRFFLETDKFYNVIFYYLNKRCMALGHELVSIVVNDYEERTNTISDIIQNRVIDGIFLVGEIDSAYITKIKTFNIPFVAIDFYKPDLEMDCIITDNFFLGFQASQYLIQRGHKDIGFVGDINQTSSVIDRYFGFQRGMSIYHFNINKEWVFSNNDYITGNYHLDLDLPACLPTAFICHCDMSAYYLIQTLKKRNISVPNDISIVSFDNTDLSKLTIPPLTTIEIDKSDMAAKAITTLIYKIEKSNVLTQRVYTRTKLIERESVNCLTNR